MEEQTTMVEATESVAEEKKKDKKKKHNFSKHFSKKKIIITIAVVLIVALLAYFFLGKKEPNQAKAQNYVEAVAEVGTIVATVEQSGVVEPLDRYEITSLVRGEIISSPFEEGDQVKEGDVLYQIDDEDAQLTVEKAQMSVDEANDNVSKLNIYAPSSGRLTNFSLEIGDNVGNGLIGNIINTDILTVDVPFSISDFNKISVGDRVTITSAMYMTSLSGKVSHKYYANSATGSESSILRNVEIEITNPGALAENTTFAATVHTTSGDVNSSGSGTIGTGNVSELRAEVNGTVSYIGAKNGDYVNRGDLLVSLTNQSVLNSQKSSQLNLKSNRKTLDNYKITAPIAGTVITKNSKAGDNIDSSNAQTVMMVIADMSKMKFTISVDELDISDIKLGQKATVDADALPNERFEAEVTMISSEGVSSGDGVTTYDIELTINEPGNLKSGMNVNATIFINQANNVIMIPEDALMSVRGTKASVLVKTDNNAANANKNAGNGAPNNANNQTKPNGAPTGGPNANGGNGNAQKPAVNPKGAPTGGPNANGANGNANNANAQKPAVNPKGTPTGGPNANGTNGSAMRGKNMLPDGYEMREVEIGISDGTYIEIVSGLSKGDVVLYIPSTASSQNRFNMGMMMGGMPGGGMPGGGMPRGGMSGGNNRGGNNRANSGR